MKKTANKNFIMAILLVAAMTLVCILLGVVLIDLDGDLDSAKNSISTTVGDGAVEDVEGYGVIAESIAYGFGAFAGAILLVIIFLVGGYAFVLFLIALIARLIYAKEGKKLLAYRILMGVEYLLQTGLFLFFIDSLMREFNVIILIMMLLVLAEIVYGVINTYTGRICE